MRSAVALALANASLGSLTESPGASSLFLFELSELGHQEEAVSERRRELGGPERERPGLHRSEEHTSELQSRLHLVCRLLLEKKKKNKRITKGDEHRS